MKVDFAQAGFIMAHTWAESIWRDHMTCAVFFLWFSYVVTMTIILKKKGLK